MNNLEREEQWINAWNDLYDLTREIQGSEYDVTHRDGTPMDFEECQEWLQRTSYKGRNIALSRYKRKDDKYRIMVSDWEVGAPQPLWVKKTNDGYVFEKRL